MRQIIEKIMLEALQRFSETHNVDISKMCIHIHTKKEDFETQYFYSVDGESVKEDGVVKDLDFTKDILGVKFDLRGRWAIADLFIKKYMKRIAHENSADPRQMYIIVRAATEQEIEAAQADAFEQAKAEAAADGRSIPTEEEIETASKVVARLDKDADPVCDEEGKIVLVKFQDIIMDV